MSFWVGPTTRRSTVQRRPAPPGMAPSLNGGPAPKTFPKQKQSNSASSFKEDGSAPDIKSDSSFQGSGLFPPARRGRRGTVQGAPPAPAKRAPRAPPPKRKMPRFNNTPPANSRSGRTASAIRRGAPPPITTAMKKEVRRKSGFTIIDDLSDEEEEVEDLPAVAAEPEKKKKKKKKMSSMFRTNTDTEWTDNDLDALHGDMKDEFARLMSVSNTPSMSNPRQLNGTKSMSHSRAIDSNATGEDFTVKPDLGRNETVDILDTPNIGDTTENDITPTATPKNHVPALLPDEIEGGEAAESMEVKGSSKKISSIDSEMTFYDSVDIQLDAVTNPLGSADLEQKRSARDNIEDAPLTQNEINNAANDRFVSRSSSVQIESTTMSL